MAAKSNLSVVIDIGTSKIAALAGQKTEEGKIEILGMAQAPSKGIKRGAVFNIDDVATAVNLVIGEIENQTEEEVRVVSVSFAGQYMKALKYRGYRYTSGEGVVTKADLNELYNEARNLKVEQDYKTIHVIPQSFLVDEEAADLNPVGITGRKLEANYKLIIVPEVQLTNIQKVFDKLGIEIEEIVLSPLAVSEAVLTDDEKEIGAMVLDIGAGTTKLAVYHENVLAHTAVIPFGGNVITGDIKEGCSILAKWAEQLKIKYGQALGDFADEQKVVTIPGYNGWEPKEISFKSLAFIIQARLEEIVDSVFVQLEKSEIDGQVGSGIVITGGTSNLNNVISLVKFRTGMDARKAFSVIHPVNKRKEFQNHEYLTALGLLKLSLNNTPVFQEKEKEKEKQKKTKRKRDGNGSSWMRVVQGVLDYIDDDNDDVAMK
jgi:cell division protein FtsA